MDNTHPSKRPHILVITNHMMVTLERMRENIDKLLEFVEQRKIDTCIDKNIMDTCDDQPILNITNKSVRKCVHLLVNTPNKKSKY